MKVSRFYPTWLLIHPFPMVSNLGMLWFVISAEISHPSILDDPQEDDEDEDDQE